PDWAAWAARVAAREDGGPASPGLPAPAPAVQRQPDQGEDPVSSETVPVIRIRSVTKRYVLGDIEVQALRGVSLDIGRGEFVAIMGPSGSGKSTLMNTIGCLDQPTSGSYQLDGVEVVGLSNDELAVIRNRK